MLVKKQEQKATETVEEPASDLSKRYQLMKTVVGIPFEPAPQDPEWLVKKHMNKRLNALEAEEYFKYLHERNIQRTLKETCPAINKRGGDLGVWKGVPTQKQIEQAIL